MQIELAGNQTIDEIDVFAPQDNWQSPVEPTETMTFSQLGLSGFDVQYWNGSSWVTVPGGSVTGNNLVWRKFTFAPVTTSKIRVLTNASASGWSRLTEVEAWTPASGGSSSSSEVLWLVSDHLGTPRMILDQSGSLANIKRHDYLPFGEELFAGTGGRTTGQGYTASDNVRQKFTSKERDNETGLDYFGARYYASSQGRFTSVDPIYFQAEMPTDPQRFNLYAYTRNNPLKFIDPEGEAVELTGDEEARKRQLEALRSAVGKQAGAYLYENKVDGKYYVGVYTNGPNGKGKDFKDLNEVAGEFAPIIADTKVLTIETVAVGTVVESSAGRITLTPSEACNCIANGSTGASAIVMQGADANHFRLLLPMPQRGSALDKAGIDPVDPVQMSDGRPGYNDWGILVGHEFGHARARMMGEPDSNRASLRLENKVRELRDKKAATRVYHSTREALAP